MLGDLTLTGSKHFPDPTHGFWFEVCAEGTEFGSPEAVTRIVTSLLTDGAIVSYDSDANRTIPVRVRVNGPTLAAVAQGEAALRRASKRRNELTWQPPDTFAPVSVYESYPSSMRSVQESGWDLDEKLRRVRTFALSLTCSPFARSADLTTVDALASGVSSVVVDACDSTAGWTTGISANPDALSASAGAVWTTDSAAGDDRMSLYRSAPIDVSAHPYFRLEWKANPGAGYMILGVPSAPDQFPSELRRLALEDGWFRSTWLVEPGDLDSGFQLSYASTVPSSTDFLGIREVLKSDIQPNQTPRQVSRILEVGGTERTPASIRVASANGTDNLGLTIVHTSPEDGSGYSPPLRRWRVAGNTVTTDSLTVSGGREPLHPDPVQFNVPTSSLPSGGYLLCAYVRVGLAGTYSVYFASYTEMPPPNEAITAGEVINQVDIEFPEAHTWVLVPLGIMELPTVRTSSGQVLVGIQRANDETVDMLIDEAWLFRVDDDCALTIADVAASNLWLDSPDVNSTVPRVWMGDSPEVRTHPGPALESPGNHMLHPDGTAVFVSTLGTQWPEVSGSFYRRWPFNAAD